MFESAPQPRPTPPPTPLTRLKVGDGPPLKESRTPYLSPLLCSRIRSG